MTWTMFHGHVRLINIQHSWIPEVIKHCTIRITVIILCYNWWTTVKQYQKVGICLNKLSMFSNTFIGYNIIKKINKINKIKIKNQFVFIFPNTTVCGVIISGLYRKNIVSNNCISYRREFFHCKVKMYLWYLYKKVWLVHNSSLIY